MQALKEAISVNPQSEPIRGREADMIQNNAGGFVFEADMFQQFQRFLILGTETGSYYASSRELTIDNISCIEKCMKNDLVLTVNVLLEISDSNRAIKNDQCIFALAYLAAFCDPTDRDYVMNKITRICRTGAHILMFVMFIRQMRAITRKHKEHIAAWYLLQSEERSFAHIVHQCVKYRNRCGYTHRDVLRLTHPKTVNKVFNDFFSWITHSDTYSINERTQPIVKAFTELQNAEDEDAAVKLLQANHDLTHDMVPTHLKGAKVWYELMHRLPMHALIRNLSTLTRHGCLESLSADSSDLKRICAKLTDSTALIKARIHPMKALLAYQSYNHGRSRSGAEWQPTEQISDALHQAIQRSFKTLEPIQKRVYIAIDVSYSMAHNSVSENVSCAQIAGVVAVMLANQCEDYTIRAFADQMRSIPLTKHTTVSESFQLVQDRNFGRTDCALPMLDAAKNNLNVDLFVILTDNETWCGSVHPMKALQDYRRKSGIQAKLITAGLVSNGFSIADPQDMNTLDVVGFDSNLADIIREFANE